MFKKPIELILSFLLGVSVVLLMATTYGTKTTDLSNVTGTLALANGGTGSTGAAGARDNIGLGSENTPDWNGATINGALVYNTLSGGNPQTIPVDATAFSVTPGNIFTTSANTVPTAILDFTSPTVNQIIILCGGSDTDASTIADAGNFNLSAAMTLNVDDCIALRVQADNDYIELWRVNN